MANVSLSAPRLATYATLAAEGQLPNSEQLAAEPGELTLSGASFGLADTEVTPGTYTAANITIDAKGRITAAADGVTGLDGLYLRRDGSTPLTAPWNAGAHAVTLGATLTVSGAIQIGTGATISSIVHRKADASDGILGDMRSGGNLLANRRWLLFVGATNQNFRLNRYDASGDFVDRPIDVQWSDGVVFLRETRPSGTGGPHNLGATAARWGTIHGTVANFSGAGLFAVGGNELAIGSPSSVGAVFRSGAGDLQFRANSINSARIGSSTFRPEVGVDLDIGTSSIRWRHLNLSGNIDATGQLTANGLAYPSNASGSVGDLVRKSANGVLSLSSFASLGLPAVGTTNNSTLRWDTGTSRWVENVNVRTSTSGGITAGGGITLSSGSPVVTLGDGTGLPTIIYQKSASLGIVMDFRSAGTELTDRKWLLIFDQTTDNFRLSRRNASGTHVDNAFSVNWSTGVFTLAQNLEWTTSGRDVGTSDTRFGTAFGTTADFSGTGTFGARLSTVAGSAASPSFGFGTDSTTGLYRPGANQIGFATAGSARWIIRSTGVLDAIGSPDIGTSSTRVATVFGATANFSGNGTFSGTTHNFGGTSAGTSLNITKGETNTAALMFRAGSTGNTGRRWAQRVQSNSGGQHFDFERYDASGDLVDTPLRLVWDTGNVQVANSLGVLGGIGCALGGAFGEEVTAGHHVQATQHVVAGTYVQAGAGIGNGFQFSNDMGIFSYSPTSLTFSVNELLTLEEDDAFGGGGYSAIFDARAYPGSNNTYSLGLTTRRWSNVFSVAGDFTGSVGVVGNITVRGDIDTDDPGVNNIGRDSSRFASVHADYIMGGALGGDYDGSKGGGLMGAELTGVINGTETVTLPPASTRAVYLIINRHETNSGTITRTGSDTINGAAANFTATRMTLSIAISDGGTNWIVTIIGNFSADPT